VAGRVMDPGRGAGAEIRKIEQAIADLGGAAALDPPTDSGRVVGYVHCLFQKASIAGDLAAFDEVERAIGRALPLLARPADLLLLKADLVLKRHRLADAEAILAADPFVCGCVEGRLLRADLDFQRGRYPQARDAYGAVLEVERSCAALARLAYLIGKMGDPAGADRLYEEAQDELTAKELRSFAWLEVQRGFLDFAHGRFSEARSHYERADQAYPGYWLTDEHLAELFAAEERYAEAIAILVRPAAAGGRPDLAQAIGELYHLAGDTEQAKCWSQQALAAYRLSAERGEVCFWHHLADFYAEVARDGAQAVAWARKDAVLRENFWTQAALARALFCDGRFDEAKDWIDRALGSGVVDARLYSDAGRIYSAAGNSAAGRAFLDRALGLNPMIDRFHLHH
jgi:tetratricopeptide (TPR) repeat protein